MSLLDLALGGGLSKDTMVELRGLEPLTPTLPVWCATSCATAPYLATEPCTTADVRHYTADERPPTTGYHQERHAQRVHPP